MPIVLRVKALRMILTRFAPSPVQGADKRYDMIRRTTQRQTLTVAEAARILGISRGAAYEAARVGQLPTLRIGRRLLVPIPALERMLADAAPRSATAEHH